jgi:hypothetical protein
MNTITDNDLEIIALGVVQNLRRARAGVILGVQTLLVGRTVDHTHHMDDPANPDGVIAIPVQAQVVGARWTYEDEILLEITYPHPRTGETHTTTRYMM